ncbi:helix-turn-helix domain-containing protein [Streptomyces sp. NPDC016172]|uniref:helix-turn-helix domain-containing protein n=1 Tax=Streptomyces sp. NPDC016172 TaxID=3364964 RepID=UPI0037001842
MAGAESALPDEPTDPKEGTFAARLDRLFKTVHPADRGPFNNSEVARKVGVSPTYIGNLRTGKSVNPTLAQMTKLAEHFGVPVAYFVDDGEGAKARDDIALLGALKDAGARQIALRTIASLPDEAVDAIVPVLEQLKAAQGSRRMPSRRQEQPGPDSSTPL